MKMMKISTLGAFVHHFDTPQLPCAAENFSQKFVRFAFSRVTRDVIGPSWGGAFLNEKIPILTERPGYIFLVLPRSPPFASSDSTS